MRRTVSTGGAALAAGLGAAPVADTRSSQVPIPSVSGTLNCPARSELTDTGSGAVGLHGGTATGWPARFRISKLGVGAPMSAARTVTEAPGATVPATVTPPEMTASASGELRFGAPPGSGVAASRLTVIVRRTGLDCATGERVGGDQGDDVRAGQELDPDREDARGRGGGGGVLAQAVDRDLGVGHGFAAQDVRGAAVGGEVGGRIGQGQLRRAGEGQELVAEVRDQGGDQQRGGRS